MNRRISKSNTNYHFQKYYAETYLKKHSFNEEDWKFAAADPAVNKTIESHSLTLFFQNPQTLLNCRRLQHYGNTQRLREGLYILFRGRIRVLLSNPCKNSSKVDIQHAIHKMENSSKFKCTFSKLNIIEVCQPFQVVNCTSNCLALANTDCWFITPEELNRLHYYQNQAKLKELLSLNARVFSVNPQLLFIFKLISLSFRNRVDLSDEIQLAIIKKGAIRVQWRANPCQQLIIAEGNAIIKSNDYIYTCESSEAELVGIQSNKTFKYIEDPLWTKRPEATPPVLPKQSNPNQMLLFRSRSINLERLTAQSASRAKYQKSLSVQKDHNSNRLLTLQTAASTPNYREVIKQNWIFMRKIENYQVASNTRSEMEYQRIQAIRLRFKKEKKNQMQMNHQNEVLLAKKKPRVNVKFIKFKPKQNVSFENSHLLHSVNIFYSNKLSQNNR